MRAGLPVFSRLALGCVLAEIAIAVCAAVLAWVKADEAARHEVDLLGSDTSSSVARIEYFLADHLIKEMPDPDSVKSEDLVRWMGALGLDEITVVNRDGKMTATTAPVPGEDNFFRLTGEYGEKYRGLLTGDEDYVGEPLRISVSGKGPKMFFAAIPYPDRKGFVQVGIDSVRFRRDFAISYSWVTDDWPIGKAGYHVIVEEESERMLSIPRSVGALSLGEAGIGRLGTREGFKFAEVRCAGFSVVHWKSSDEMTFIAVAPIFNNLEPAEIATFVLFELLVVVVFILIGRAIWRTGKIRLAEMDTARRIQLSALPASSEAFPGRWRYELSAKMRPARAVGGDFYDYYPCGPNHLVFLVADVSDKGIPAAMFMMRAKAVLSCEITSGKTLAEAVAVTNGLLCEGNDENMFLTAWIGKLDLATGELEYVNAGHNPPVVRGEYLRKRTGLILGMAAGAKYRSEKIKLGKGDSIFVYSDGVTEARSASRAFFGEERLLAHLVASGSGAEGVFAAVDRFATGAEQADDITVLSLVYRGAEKEYPATREGFREATKDLATLAASNRAKVVLDEIVSNIVRCAGAQTFSVAYRGSGEKEELVFEDDGAAFDPLGYEEVGGAATLESRMGGGMGIGLVRKMASGVEYARCEGRNRLAVTLRG